ncbi:MAG: hypothetical protein J6S60_09280 [Oscillospiraceae bacterium]|nr:hypothetical protein [Oscillospiraceae bacterium]
MDDMKREKVIEDLTWATEEKDVRDALYADDLEGVIDIMKDAITLLKAQEPRVMTLEEVLNAENRAEPLWCEFIDCALGSWRMGWKLRTEGKREVQHILENPIERAIVWESEYGRGWRCWTSRPTDVQREETPW